VEEEEEEEEEDKKKKEKKDKSCPVRIKFCDGKQTE
jgi:hypothetical protein